MCQAPQPSFAKSVAPISKSVTDDLRGNRSVQEVPHSMVQPFQFNGGTIRVGSNNYPIPKVELSPLQVAFWF